MDFELPFLSRLLMPQVPELSARDALMQVALSSNRGRRPGKVKVTGRVASPLRSETPETASFELDDEGTRVMVVIPRSDATGLIAGQRVVTEGRFLLAAQGSSLQAVLKGHIVPAGQLRPDIAKNRVASRLILADFLQRHAEGLVILGSERAIHDVDDELKKVGRYPGPFRREIVRMTEGSEVLAAARRYMGRAQGLLFVRRGGESQEFQFWNDAAFIEDLLATDHHIYLGLGHAEDRTALDALADETFPTASAAGTTLAHALMEPRRVQREAEIPKAAPSVATPREKGQAAALLMADGPDIVSSAPSPAADASELVSVAASRDADGPEFSKPAFSVANPLERIEAPSPQNSKPEVKEELYLSNTMIWAVALILGAIILIVGLR